MATRATEVSTAPVAIGAPGPLEETVWKEPPRWLPPTLHAFAYHNFTLLWLGQITNSLAMWMDMVARPILVLLVTGSAVQMGLIVAARGVPMMLLQPLGGVMADRFDRRLLMLWSKALSMVVNFAFAFIILSGNLELWHIYATAILRSMLMAFDSPARFALLPNLVPPRLLINAIGLNSGSMQLVRILSGAVAGLSIALFAILGTRLGIGGQYFGVGCTYLLAALFYVMAVTLTYKLQVPASGRVARTEEGWLTSLLSGVKFAAHSQPIMGILLLLGLQTVFGMPYLHVFIPLIAIQTMDFGFLSTFGFAEHHRQSEIGFGILMATSGIGGLLGTLWIATVGERLRHKGLWNIGGQVAYGVAILAFGLSASLSGLAPAFTLIAIIGLGQAVVMATKNAVIVEQTPNEMRGRVFSLQGLDRGLTTVGGTFSGFMAAAIGAPMAMALFGGLCVAGTLAVGALLPGLRRVG